MLKTAKSAKPAKPAARRPAAKAAAKPDTPLTDLTRDALGEVTETLEFMWTATQAVFGDKATPDHAIALLPYAMDALELRRLLIEDSGRRAAAPARARKA